MIIGTGRNVPERRRNGDEEEGQAFGEKDVEERGEAAALVEEEALPRAEVVGSEVPEEGARPSRGEEGRSEEERETSRSEEERETKGSEEEREKGRSGEARETSRSEEGRRKAPGAEEGRQEESRSEEGRR
jgi:hypothetical protein